MFVVLLLGVWAIVSAQEPPSNGVLEGNNGYETYSSAQLFLASTAPINAHAPEKEKIARYIVEVFGTYEAVKIAKCESRLIPHRVNWGDIELNGFPSRGIFQISDQHWDSDWAWNDWRENTRRAKILYDERGWRPWENCAKLNNLL